MLCIEVPQTISTPIQIILFTVNIYLQTHNLHLQYTVKREKVEEKISYINIFPLNKKNKKKKKPKKKKKKK